MVVAVGPMVAGADDGELQGGGRSLGNGGDGTTGHGRANPWVLRVHRNAASTLVMLGRRGSRRSSGDELGEVRSLHGTEVLPVEPQGEVRETEMDRGGEERATGH